MLVCVCAHVCAHMYSFAQFQCNYHLLEFYDTEKQWYWEGHCAFFKKTKQEPFNIQKNLR